MKLVSRQDYLGHEEPPKPGRLACDLQNACSLDEKRKTHVVSPTNFLTELIEKIEPRMNLKGRG